MRQATARVASEASGSRVPPRPVHACALESSLVARERAGQLRAPGPGAPGRTAGHAACRWHPVHGQLVPVDVREQVRPRPNIRSSPSREVDHGQDLHRSRARVRGMHVRVLRVHELRPGRGCRRGLRRASSWPAAHQLLDGGERGTARRFMSRTRPADATGSGPRAGCAASTRPPSDRARPPRAARSPATSSPPGCSRRSGPGIDVGGIADASRPAVHVAHRAVEVRYRDEVGGRLHQGLELPEVARLRAARPRSQWCSVTSFHAAEPRRRCPGGAGRTRRR